MLSLLRLLGRLTHPRPRESFTLLADEEGVALAPSDGVPRRKFRWQDVEEIKTYKLDCLTVDDIRLAFLVGECWYDYSEDCPGFSLLTREMQRAFPTITE